MRLPVHGGPAGPSPFARQYACGAFEGYVIVLSLSGKYRAENNALARKLGYKPGNAPLVPLRGSIVSDRSHEILEIYEGMYQFSTSGAAARFIQIGAPSYQRVGGGDAHADMPRPLPAHLPATAVSERSLWSSALGGAARSR